MAVLPARIPASGLARFYTNVLALSPTYDVVHRDEDGINVELTGTQERSFYALLGTGARVGTVRFFRQGPKRSESEPDGQSGDGVLNDEAEARASKETMGENLPVSHLMGKPKF